VPLLAVKFEGMYTPGIIPILMFVELLGGTAGLGVADGADDVDDVQLD